MDKLTSNQRPPALPIACPQGLAFFLIIRPDQGKINKKPLGEKT